MEGILPAADMQRWVAARSKPKYAALQMTQVIRKAQVTWYLIILNQRSKQQDCLQTSSRCTAALNSSMMHCCRTAAC